MQLATIHESDMLRQSLSSLGVGVGFLTLGVGKVGEFDNSHDCDPSVNKRLFDDPFECVNNVGQMMQRKLMARIAKDTEYLSNYLSSDGDGDPDNGIQPVLDFPSCLPGSLTAPGLVGKSFVAQESEAVNAYLATYAKSIKAALIK